MKKIMVLLILSSVFQTAQGMFKEFVEQGVSTNRFLDQYVGGTCPASSTSTNVTDCGNSYINDVIGVNFLEASMLTLGTYIMYNDFGTYVEQMSADFNNTPPPGVDRGSDDADDTIDSWTTGLNASMDGLRTDSDDSSVKAQSMQAQFLTVTADDYPAVGVYQLEISTSSSVQEAVLPDLEPVEGAIKLVARLRYNGGASNSQDDTQNIYLWSQHAIYLKPTDSFRIVISNDEDDTAIASESTSTDFTSSTLAAYFQYDDHTTADCPAYKKATKSPRKVRLEIV